MKVSKQGIILSVCFIIQITIFIVYFISLVEVKVAVKTVEEQLKPQKSIEQVKKMEFTKAQSIEQVRKMKFTEEQMNIIVQHVDDVTIKQVTEKLGSATPTEYVQTFIEVDPSLVSVIQEFR